MGASDVPAWWGAEGGPNNSPTKHISTIMTIEPYMGSAASVIFHGKVQGVFFRANTKKKADELGLRGWVRNLPDGTVEALFIGERVAIEQTIDWCENSQPHARVDEVNVRWLDDTGKMELEMSDSFIVRY